MAQMVEKLGPAGMSSDESDVDDNTEKTSYRIKRRLWRAKACKERLILIDGDHNFTNAYGGARPGKPPREQNRTSTSTISTRPPTAGCPKNFYSREWVSNQGSSRAIKDLTWGVNKDLETFV